MLEEDRDVALVSDLDMNAVSVKRGDDFLSPTLRLFERDLLAVRASSRPMMLGRGVPEDRLVELLLRVLKPLAPARRSKPEDREEEGEVYRSSPSSCTSGASSRATSGADSSSITASRRSASWFRSPSTSTA